VASLSGSAYRCVQPTFSFLSVLLQRSVKLMNLVPQAMPRQQIQDVFRIGGFGEMTIEPGLVGLLTVLISAIAADGHQQAFARRLPRFSSQAPRHLQPIQGRQANVQQDGVGRVTLNTYQRMCTLKRTLDLIALEFQLHGHAAGGIHVVINHQHAVAQACWACPTHPAHVRSDTASGSHRLKTASAGPGVGDSMRPPST